MFAHYVYERQLVWFTQEKCVQVRSEVSHGDGGGYFKTDARSLREFNPGGSSCESRDSVPAGWLAANPIPMVYYGEGYGENGWVHCGRYGNYWYFNQRKVSEMWAVSRPYVESGPCGSRWYGNLGLGYVWWNNEWQGGGLWSGNHWLD